MSAATARPVALYLHTHWDREWYRSFEAYRLRLCRTLIQILTYLEADPQRVFLLDGQTVVLEDFLEIHPEYSEQIQALVQAGRLQIGPWYVLPDEFLVSGEALIRNLQYGVKQARSFGQQRFVGYLPDMFGHLAQMPQLLAQAQLSPALIWRGTQPESAYFLWEALDGTQLPTVHLTKGYYQDALHQSPPAWETLADFLNAIAAVTPAELPLLLPVGADHMGLPPDLAQNLTEAQSRWPAYAFELGSLLDYIQQVEQAPRPELRLKGELRQPDGAYVLPGVWSARRYLKQANDQIQTLLERELEPLLVFHRLSGGQPAWPLLWQAWKYLLQNQPHDSICGCSIDEVHQDMLPRFRWAREIARELQTLAWQEWGGQQAGASPGLKLNLLNTSPTVFTGVIQVQLSFAAAEEIRHFTVLDPQGQPVACEVLRSQDSEVFVAEPEILPHWEPVRQFDCLLQVRALAAMSCTSYTLVPHQQPVPLPQAAQSRAEHSIENEWLKVNLDQQTGRLALYRKDHLEQTWIGVAEGHFFVSEGDAGDEYNYDPPLHDQVVELNATAVQVEHLALGNRLHLTYQGFVPAGLNEDRQSRSKLTSPLRIQSWISLYADERQLHISTRLHNQVRDQRLRLIWQTPFTQVRCHAGTAFGALERQALTHLPQAVPKGQESPVETFPFSEWIHLEAPDDNGWLLKTEGLHEAALTEWEGKAALSLTLLRSVGWLSRDDLRTRGGGAGPRMPTPEAQCLGEQRFDYVLQVCGNQRQAALQALNTLRHPLQVFQGTEPVLKSLFSDLPAAIHVSALTWSLDQQAVLLRLVNEQSEPLALTLAPGFACTQVTRTDPLEQAETPVSDFQLILGAGEIATFKFYPASTDNLQSSAP